VYARGAEGVRRSEEHGQAFSAQTVGQLPDRGGLAGTVHAQDEHHGRSRIQMQRYSCPEQPLEDLPERRADGGRVSSVPAGPQLLDDVLGRGNADVALYENGFKLLVELGPGGLAQGLLDAGGEGLARAREARPEAVEDTHTTRIPARSSDRYGLGDPLLRQTHRDDLRDAGDLHRYAVEHVRGLHRALVVGDDEHLRALGELAQQRGE